MPARLRGGELQAGRLEIGWLRNVHRSGRAAHSVERGVADLLHGLWKTSDCSAAACDYSKGCAYKSCRAWCVPRAIVIAVKRLACVAFVLWRLLTSCY